MHKISFTKAALFDVRDIIFWYEEQRTGLSYDFELCLEAALSEISRNPESFQNRYRNIKVRFTPRFPYGIHYLVKENTIVIVGVFHTSLSPKKWSERI